MCEFPFTPPYCIGEKKIKIQIKYIYIRKKRDESLMTICSHFSAVFTMEELWQGPATSPLSEPCGLPGVRFVLSAGY